MRVWDAATGQPVGQPLNGHTDTVSSVAFSPDGTADRLRQRRQHGAGVGRGHRPPVGDPLTGHTDVVSSVAFSPDGKRHRLRQRRQDGAGVGRGHRPTRRRPADRPHGRCTAWRSAPTAADRLRQCRHTVRLWPAYPDATSALCAKLTTNMSHQQWRDWMSPESTTSKPVRDFPSRPMVETRTIRLRLAAQVPLTAGWSSVATSAKLNSAELSCPPASNASATMNKEWACTPQWPVFNTVAPGAVGPAGGGPLSAGLAFAAPAPAAIANVAARSAMVVRVWRWTFEAPAGC